MLRWSIDRGIKMAQLSPGIITRELDLTAVVPQISTTDGAVIGEFEWGAVEQVSFLSSEDLLAEQFGKPSDETFLSFFTAANFLAYGNKLQLVRVLEPDVLSTTTAFAGTFDTTEPAVLSGGRNSSDGRNLVVGSGGTTPAYNDRLTIKNIGDFDSKDPSTLDNDNLGHFLAKYPGSQGDSLRVSICPSSAAFGGSLANAATILNIGNVDFDNVGGTLTSNITTNATVDFTVFVKVGDTIQLDGSADAATIYTVDAVTSNTVLTVTSSGPVQAVDIDDSSTELTQTSNLLLQVGENINSFITNETKIIVDGDERTVASTPDSLNGTLIQVALKNGAALTPVSVDITTPLTYSWEYAGSFDSAPTTSDYVATAGGSNDELHLIVVDEGGLFTGTQRTVLETWPFLSKASDARAVGINNFYATVLNRRSQYIYILQDHSEFAALFLTGVAGGTDGSGMAYGSGQIITSRLSDGLAGAAKFGEGPNPASLIAGYNIFSNADTFNVSLMMMGAPTGLSGTGGSLAADDAIAANYKAIVETAIGIAENRKDFVLFVSPLFRDIGGTESDAVKAQNAVTRRNDLTSSSYVFMDSGWKYQYDKYNDTFRNVPLNGDTAGVCVRSDIDRDPWFSPAGFNRGVVRNVVRLPFSPGRNERDTLYKNSVNPITTFTGEGTVLFGDKTLLAKPNAFDRINVRRLFIILEKTISSAALTTLFEFNDQFTRQQFVNLVEPFLRQVQGRSGISDFRVICDETNNTPQIIDTNNFVCSVFVKPARSINFITLNFVSVNSGVEFDEVVGAV